jgi:deferrochelatase/peroxidase EfeB
MTPIDYSDVQGLAAFGYKKLVEARFWLLRIRDRAAARVWLASAPVSTAERKATAPETALQVALTASGLRALGLPPAVVDGFSAEFLSGMASEDNRSRRLGDLGANAPANWLWGRSGKEIDLAVMTYAQRNLPAWEQTVQSQPWNAAFEIATPPLETSDMGGYEPFGFVDGLSQPEFDWERKSTSPATSTVYANRMAIGELLLGYPNEYDKYTDRPLIAPAQDPANRLLPAEDQPGLKDFGRNGTYLVLRQLEQNVRGLWQYLDRQSGADPAARYQLAAAFVGRTLDGDPIVQPGQSDNEFTYLGDPDGLKCPFGAHIRRANPRNADMVGDPSGIRALFQQLGFPRPGLRDDLTSSTRFHRLLRRGREYGVKISPEDALQPAPPGELTRGLQFACLCANILRQFEFVQGAWLMSTKFNGMTEESDPILGNRLAVGDCPVTGNFTIPRQDQAARRLTGVPQFITVRGGSYFFLPSLSALRYIADGKY